MTEDSSEVWERIHLIEEKNQESQVKLAREIAILNVQIAQLIKLAETFVTKERFFIIQLLVYGFAGLMLTSVLGALIAKVIIK